MVGVDEDTHRGTRRHFGFEDDGSCLYGGLWVQESEHTHWAVGRRPLRSSKVQLSPPDRYGPTLTFAHRASKTTKLSRPHTPAVIHLWKPRVSAQRQDYNKIVYTLRFVACTLPGTYTGAGWKPRGYTEVSYNAHLPPRSHHPAGSSPMRGGIIRRTPGQARGVTPWPGRAFGRPSPASHHPLHLGDADGLATKGPYMM